MIYNKRVVQYTLLKGFHTLEAVTVKHIRYVTQTTEEIHYLDEIFFYYYLRKFIWRSNSLLVIPASLQG